MRHLSHTEQSIIIDSLLLKIQELEKEIKQTEKQSASSRFQTSVFKYFLVDEHPEMTNEFADYVLSQSKNNDMFGDETKFAYDVLDYHRYSVDDKRLDEVLEILNKNR